MGNHRSSDNNFPSLHSPASRSRKRVRSRKGNLLFPRFPRKGNKFSRTLLPPPLSRNRSVGPVFPTSQVTRPRPTSGHVDINPKGHAPRESARILERYETLRKRRDPRSQPVVCSPCWIPAPAFRLLAFVLWISYLHLDKKEAVPPF